MALVFFGSGSFAVPSLEALALSPSPPTLVITRPDRPGRRGPKPVPTPVRQKAIDLGLAVEAPETANGPEFVERLRSLGPDLAIIVDYGEILRETLRSVPRIGIFNLHASVLPRHRGAAPVVAALLAGDPQTGVTLFRITKGLDAGPVTDIIRTPVDPLETAGELEDRLALLGADLLLRNLERLLSGRFDEEPQDDRLATLAPKIPKGAGGIDWSLEVGPLAGFIRAMSPRPGAFGFLRRAGSSGAGVERMKILRAVPSADPSARPEAAHFPAPPGTVILANEGILRIACGSGGTGRIDILEIQASGKAALRTAEFLRGQRLRPGDAFDPAAQAAQ